MAVAGSRAALEAALAQATALQAQGRDGEAVPILRDVLRAAPGHPVALNNLGAAVARGGDFATAETYFRTALDGAPEYPDALANLAGLLARRGAVDEALERLSRAGPGRAATWNDLGTALHLAERPAAAVDCFARAVLDDPAMPQIYNNLSIALTALGRRAEALAAVQQAIALRPRYLHAWVNLASVHGALEPEAALRAAQAGVLCDPRNADAHHNLGLALLGLGNYAAGWPEYAWWEHTPQAEAETRGFDVPRWDGGALDGTLLLHVQQGFGDAIQFVRYVRALPVPAVLEAPARLVRLFSPLIETIARGSPRPAHVAECPLHLLAARAGGKPRPFPYLSAEPGKFAARLAALPGRRIGLCWGGNPGLGRLVGLAVDARRSIPLTEFDVLADVPGVSFVSLQVGRLPDPAARIALHDWTAELADFADTAALISGLDLVITVDTVIAHLAGAMGKPVWLLNRLDSDWRWGLGREDCDWYIALRQFRQDRMGDWAEVLTRVRDALDPPALAPIVQAAEAAWLAGERLEAARGLRRAAALRPDFADGQNNLGLALSQEDNLPAAEAALRAALLSTPSHVPALVNLGMVRRRRGDAREAEALYRRAIMAGPEQSVARMNLGNLLAETGRGAEAVGLYDSVGDPTAQVHAAIVLTQLRRPGEAIARLRPVLATAPRACAGAGGAGRGAAAGRAVSRRFPRRGGALAGRARARHADPGLGRADGAAAARAGAGRGAAVGQSPVRPLPARRGGARAGDPAGARAAAAAVRLHTRPRRPGAARGGAAGGRSALRPDGSAAAAGGAAVDGAAAALSAGRGGGGGGLARAAGGAARTARGPVLGRLAVPARCAGGGAGPAAVAGAGSAQSAGRCRRRQLRLAAGRATPATRPAARRLDRRAGRHGGDGGVDRRARSGDRGGHRGGASGGGDGQADLSAEPQ